ncbi:MAG: NAD(P)/FAD-dependent oxidoreductase [Chitinophagales bacterium]
MQIKKILAVIGGGAAGFFAAITAAENNPDLKVIILEQGNEVLGKVKISGGGRCNVTHACFDVKELVKFYPRGHKELLGPFYRFNTEHTIQWFEYRGVELKTEADGRMFPVSDSSQSIMDCLIETATAYDIKIIKQAKVMRLDVADSFQIYFNDRELKADYLLIASGSSNTIWQQLKKLGHEIIEPVPSLFTFNIRHELIKGLEGISFQQVSLSLKEAKIETQGALLITHTGLSGPAILKLSAFAARLLNEKKYQFELMINWIDSSTDEAMLRLKSEKDIQAKRQASNFSPFELPQRFWLKVLEVNGIPANKLVADLSRNELQNIANALTKCVLKVHSKNTNKEEFVTAGGISLKEVDFKTMESKLIPNLFFAGEVLDIDAVTGGFNFQAAWTTGFIAGSSLAEKA